jgi:MFS family permease
VRGAPRDALLSREITPDQRGRAFGIQRAMDHGGALAGGVVGACLIYFHLATLEQLFWWTLLPGGMAVLIILLFVRERDQAVSAGASKPVLSIGASWRQQSPTVRRYLVVLGIFALGNSTDMLLLALSHERFLAANLPRERADAAVLLLWAWLHVVKSMSSPWGGRLSDRIGRLPTVCAGWFIYAVVYAGFALWASPVAPWVLFAVYGLYYGLVEGPQRALVADLSPDPDRRGMAYGLFHFVTGMAALPASLLCGGLWWWLKGVTWQGIDLGPLTAFGTGAALALLAAVLLPWALRVREKVSG